MIPMTLAEIAAAVGGELVDVSHPDAVVHGPVVVDSREVRAGGLFVAVPGERVDGHAHAGDAVAAGAMACLTAGHVGVPSIVVGDTVAALGRLAADVVGRLDGCTVIAITGSQGKTGTKDMLASVLATAGPTVATLGNYNNEIGLPLTALRADAGTDYLVLEMGARGVGHIRFLTELVQPSVGCVLNVGTAHIGEFGTQEAIAQAKGELVEGLPATGTAVLNADDPLVLAMADRTRAPVLTFGQAEAADLRLVDLRTESDGCPSFDLVHKRIGPGGPATDRVSVRMRLLGAHQAMNAAAAAGMGLAAGRPLAEVAAALAAATPASRWRMQPTERPDGVLVVNDAYNANPASMQAALKTLVDLSRTRGGRSFAVLGEMAELGAETTAAHDAIGRLVVRLDVDQLIVVGDTARPLHLGACLEGSWGSESILVPDVEAAVATLRDLVRPGDTVLVKASRAAALERVADAFLADVPDQPAQGRS